MKKNKRALWTATAVAGDGVHLRITVYHLGGLHYEFSCLTRGRPHLWNPKTAIDPGMVRYEIARAYGATDVQLKDVR
jgi:hypothetical protein